MAYDIEAENYDGVVFVITDAKNIKFSTHYGEKGSGFGYLRFTVERPVGYRYKEIGFAYRAILRKGLRVLFDGMIREISEVSDNESSKIDVTCLGWSVLAEDVQEVLRAFADTRLNQWKPPSEIPSGTYVPNRFNSSQNSGGLIMSATTQPVLTNDYTELKYDFFPEEVFERIKCSILLSMGTGIVFDATISSIDSGNNYIFYSGDSGEARLDANMTLVNVTKTLSISITAIDTGLNRITSSTGISTWDPTDVIVVYGPLFLSTISLIASQDITYTETYGEDNVASGNLLVNTTKKDIVSIDSINTTTNVITVTGDITGWTTTDSIQINASMFYGEISANSGGVVTYINDIGEQIVSADTGWVLHNSTQNLKATVQSWNTGANQITVTDAADVTGWIITDKIAIYSPFAVSILDNNNAVIWPTDWRDGAVAAGAIAVDELTTLSPTRARVKFSAYIAGTANDSTFVKIARPIVYSTELPVHLSNIAKWAITVLSPFGLSSTEAHIENVTKIIEPAVFDLKDHKVMFTELATHGDQSSNKVAWGVKLNDRRELFIQPYPTNTGYFIKKNVSGGKVSSASDISDSVQRIRPVYTDNLGQRQFGAWQTDPTKYFGTHYISRSDVVSNIDNITDSAALMTLILNESGSPDLSSSYKVDDGAIFDMFGNEIPFDEVVANGEYIEVEDYRSSITGDVASDLGSNWARDYLVAVEIDLEKSTISLTPGKAQKTFERYMAELARVAKV